MKILTLAIAAAGCTTESPVSNAHGDPVNSADAASDTGSSIVVTVSASAPTVRSGESLQIVVTATNSGSAPYTIQATSGCFTDYELRDASGRLAMRSGQMCAAVMSSRTLGPGDELHESFAWIPGQRGMPTVAPGSYELRGLLLQRGDTLRSVALPLSVIAGG